MGKVNISQLLASFSHVEWRNVLEPDARGVSSVCFDSRKLERDCVFVAIRGEKADGHRFLAEAAHAGALALVVDAPALVPASFDGAVVAVSDTREALNRLAALWYGEPAKRLFSVGVTGTNGKTTVTHMVEAILAHRGWPTGVIGTIDHHLGSRVWKTEMTTPDPMSFQQRLAEFASLGAKAVALEVSSHALRQCRVDEVPFDVAVFTNLSRDHLDYHRDMEDYFEAKRKLFVDLLSRSSKVARFTLINGDDEYGRRLIRAMLATAGAGVRVWSYGSAPDADFRFRVLEQGFGGTRFLLTCSKRVGVSAGVELETKTDTETEISIRLPGLHNVYNACGAIGVGVAAGASLAVCAEALSGLSGVKGRLEAVPNSRGIHVFVDYAHTDDALESVLRCLGEIRAANGLKNKIITVFGCGGDRDRGKRPLMMKAAIRGSDLVVLTSDNPRTEDPEAILHDALAGADPATFGHTVFQEVDRRAGIRKALTHARSGDVVLVAGKGHEDYQQIGTTKLPFSDIEVVKETLTS